jgi:hypothetical protein
METVGELDDEDPQVVGHGEEHLAEVAGLLFALAMEMELFEFGDALYEVGYGRAKLTADRGDGDAGVLDGIVEERSRQGVGVSLDFSKKESHLERVVDVGFAGEALLTVVGLVRETIGREETLAVLGGPIGSKAFN